MTKANGERNEFLYAAIEDIQGTIRAIDFKVSILLLVLTIPITQLSDIYGTIFALFDHLENTALVIGTLLLIAFVGTWLFSLVASMRAILAIDNPTEHIRGDKPDGAFYVAGIFTTGFADSIRNRSLQSSKTFQEHYQSLPKDDEAVTAELALEQMKLAYIRSVKVERQKWAFIFGAAWFFLGGLLWLWKLIAVA